MPHSWIPATITLPRDDEEAINMLYGLFRKDFILRPPKFLDRPIWFNRKSVPGQIYEEGFWHIISRESQPRGPRRFDPLRSEKLPWCKPTITKHPNETILSWDYVERGRRNTYLWIKERDYVVVVRKADMDKGPVAFLVTAFHVDGSSTRKSLERKYRERI